MSHLLLYVDDQLGPCAVATIPVPPTRKTAPEWYQQDQRVPLWPKTLYLTGKGHVIDWDTWAHRLAESLGSNYGGRWQIIEVPDAWLTQPEGLEQSLSWAQQNQGLG